MQFLIHGAVRPEAVDALTQRQHVCHTLTELLAEAGVPADLDHDPAVFLSWLDQKQWNLLTTQSPFVRDVYEKKIAFSGVLVLLLDDPDAPQNQPQALDRLFQRYKRLSPGRLYTVTPNRVKIRQLPGAGQRNPSRQQDAKQNP